MKKSTLIFLTLLALLSCDPDLQDIRLVYENDFENGLDEEILSGNIHEFEGSQMTGNYNNETFTLMLDQLPQHSQILIAMDLYIHDSWDGNVEGEGGPDLWTIKISDLISGPEESTRVFQTTFSNSECGSQRCLYQSYPEEYPFTQSPRAGSVANHPGYCHLAEEQRGTTLYRVEKAFRHSGESLVVQIYDQLKQTNSPSPNCDESWSMDNLKIWILNFD